MLYKEALRTGFFEFQSARDKYLQLSILEGINWSLIIRYIEIQTILLSPICPHVSEYVWKLIGKVKFFAFFKNVNIILMKMLFHKIF